MGKWLLSAISVVITSQVVCPPGGGEGSVQADEAGHVPDPGIQHRQHTLVIVAHPSPEKGFWVHYFHKSHFLNELPLNQKVMLVNSKLPKTETLHIGDG